MSTILKQRKHTNLLKREQEHSLFSAYQKTSDKEEKNKLFSKIVEHNIGLVKKIACSKKYKDSYSMDTDDFISEGIFGLRKAADKFDVNSGYKFSTYAMAWVQQCMGRAKDNKDHLVRMPVYLKDRRNKYMRARCEAIREHNDCDSDIISSFENSYLVQENFTEKQLREIKKGELAVSFADLTTTTEPNELEYLLGYVDYRKELDYAIDFKDLIETLEKTLKEDEFSVLKLRYLEGMTLDSVAQVKNASREWVRRLQEKALAKAKNILRNWVI